MIRTLKDDLNAVGFLEGCYVAWAKWKRIAQFGYQRVLMFRSACIVQLTIKP